METIEAKLAAAVVRLQVVSKLAHERGYHTRARPAIAAARMGLSDLIEQDAAGELQGADIEATVQATDAAVAATVEAMNCGGRLQ